MTGEVTRPGPYPFAPGTDVVQAIAISGGLGALRAPIENSITSQGVGRDSNFVFFMRLSKWAKKAELMVILSFDLDTS